MRTRILTAVAALVTTALLTCGPAVAAKRVALVVGNDDYENLNKLGKAVNDSRAISQALQEIGFTVISAENASRRDMNKRMSELDASIAPGDTVFFFFAGHGVALGSDNYLLPTDIPKPREGEEGLVRDEAHSVESIISRIQGRGAAVSMIVLDACRDNPFAASGTRNLGGQRGLTRIDTPDGVFVLYSAGIGQTALDSLGPGDPDQNSVFTRKLVPLLRTAGMTHVALAKTVQQEVDELANTVHHPQQPAYYDQIIGEIVLKPKQTEAPVESAKTPVSEAAETWVTVNNSTSIAVLEAYIARYKGTVFADLAQARLDEVKKAQVAGLADRTITVEPKAEAVAPEASGTTLDTPETAPAADASAAAATSEPAAEATVVASAEPTKETESATAVAPETAPSAEAATDPALLAKQLQTELKRVGCYTGETDGDWGRGSVAALQRFADATSVDFASDQPTGEALDTVSAKQDTVCEAVAEPEPQKTIKRKTKRVEPQEPKPAKRVRVKAEPKSEPKAVIKKAEPKPAKRIVTKRTKTVTSEPKRKTFLKKPGVFDCSIYGTNTALQEIHRRQGHCE
ncbi:MAG: caspase family protein [Hyphomicrobiaceae bacterium]